MSDIPTPLNPLSAVLDSSSYDPRQLEDVRKVATGALSRASTQRDAARNAYSTSVQDTIKAIDDTRARLEEAHKGQWNLPLMAFGAGMLKGTPGVASNFLTELGGGMEAAAPAIARQRMTDLEFNKNIGELMRMRAEAPQGLAKHDLTQAEKERAEALKTLEHLSIAGSRLEKPTPMPDGSVVFRDPKNPGRFIIRQPDGTVEQFDPSTGTTSPAQQEGAAPAVSGMSPSEAAKDPIAYLKTIRPDFDPSKFNEGINWAKFAEIASQRPKDANMLLKALLYEDDPIKAFPAHGNRRAVEQRKLDSLLTQIDPTWSYTDLTQAVAAKADQKWVGQGSTKAQLNTVMGHMEELLHAYEKQGNIDATGVNRIRNKLLDMFGLPTNVDQKVAAKFVADEVAKYLSGAGGSALADREELQRLFRGDASPEQALATLQTVMALTSKKANELAGIRQEQLKNRRKITMEDVLSPEAKKSVDLIGRTVVVPDKTGKPRMLVPGVSKIEGLGTYQGGDPRSDDSWKN